MREITYVEAIREALAQKMAEDPTVFLIGEDIGIYGGAFGATAGLIQQFGEERVIDTPISERDCRGMHRGRLDRYATGGGNPVHGFRDPEHGTIGAPGG